jgi:hypothetical protein
MRADGRTDGRRVTTKITVTFSSFVKAPKNKCWEDREGYLMIKVKFPCLRHEDKGGSGSMAPLILTPAALLPGRNYVAHWIEGWVGPRAGLDALEKR